LPERISEFDVIRLEETGSTSDEAKLRAADGVADATVILAKSQNKGRGRHGRQWVSPPGNLYVSVVLRPDCAPIVAATLSFVAALAAAETVAAFAPDPEQVRCKWPNDILVGGKKVAGILLETSISARQETEWVVLGVGINLASHPKRLGVGEHMASVRPSTSLLAASNSVEPSRTLTKRADSCSLLRMANSAS
jgi:BirA family biotin operon repressor/biotin-[acetyl-CoA-carboxylase] ligase